MRVLSVLMECSSEVVLTDNESAYSTVLSTMRGGGEYERNESIALERSPQRPNIMSLISIDR